MLPANTVPAPVLPIARSATGVTEVTTGGVVLFTKLVSAVEAVTLAVLEIVPFAGAITVKVKFVTALTGRVANDQFTVPALVTPPALALENITLVGSTSLATILLAVEGPPLVTTMV